MQWLGQKITQILRHRSRRDKMGDGATIDPTTLARSSKKAKQMENAESWYCSRQMTRATSKAGMRKDLDHSRPTMNAQICRTGLSATRTIRAKTFELWDSNASKACPQPEVTCSCGSTSDIGGIGRLKAILSHNGCSMEPTRLRTRKFVKIEC